MKKRKKKYLKYSKERALLSDVLPYEVPITFSNRYFYRFLVNNNIEIKENKLRFENNYTGTAANAFIEILKLLFDIRAIPLTKILFQLSQLRF